LPEDFFLISPLAIFQFHQTTLAKLIENVTSMPENIAEMRFYNNCADNLKRVNMYKNAEHQNQSSLIISLKKWPEQYQ
jgi:hypothetical protein